MGMFYYSQEILSYIILSYIICEVCHLFDNVYSSFNVNSQLLIGCLWYMESISKEMNDLNLHSMTKLSGWLRHLNLYATSINHHILSCF